MKYSGGIPGLVLLLCMAVSVFSAGAQEKTPDRNIWNVLNLEFFPVARLNLNGKAADNGDFKEYYDEKRFIRLGFEYATAGGLEVNFNLDLTQGILANKNNRLFLNVPFDPGPNVPLNGFIDTETPFEGYIAYEGNVVDLMVGRRRWGMGAGEYSLTAGRQAPWFDGVWFNIHPVIAGYRTDWTFLAAADDPGFIVNWNAPGTAHSAAYERGGDPLLDSWDSRYFLLHKSSIWGDSWKAGVAETAIVVGNMDLYSGNPGSIWHSGFLGHVNVGIELSFEKILARSWRIYSEIFFDDLPLEGGTTNPIAGAATIGADYQLFEDSGRYAGPVQSAALNAKLEDNLRFEGGLILSGQLVYTSRYVYSRSYDEAVERFTMYKHTVVGDFANYEHYTGFEYGPDTVMASLSIQWQNRSFFIKGGTAFLVRGEYGAGDQQPADSRNWYGFQKAPGGNADWLFSSTIAGYEWITDLEGYYFIRKSLSAYGRIRARLSTVPSNDNRFLLETGILFKL
jgi:hypothetical protein